MSANPDVQRYIEALQPERRAALEVLRGTVFQAVPQAAELIQYGMPYYESAGPLCAFAAQKRYMSLYIFDTAVVAKYGEELQGLDVGRSCIRFKRIEQLPLEIIASMLREAHQRNKIGSQVQ